MKKPEDRARCSALRPLTVLELERLVAELVRAAPEEELVVVVMMVVVMAVVLELPLVKATLLGRLLPPAGHLGQFLRRQRLEPLPGHR
jgi:hypothetical protein